MLLTYDSLLLPMTYRKAQHQHFLLQQSVDRSMQVFCNALSRVLYSAGVA